MEDVRGKRMLDFLPLWGMEKFQEMCVLWLLEDDVWEDVKPYFLPNKTQAVVEFEALDFLQRRKMPPSFYRDEQDGREVMEYLSKVFYSYWHNKGWIELLDRFKGYVKGNEAAVRMLDAKIIMFRNRADECEAVLSVYQPDRFKGEVLEGL